MPISSAITARLSGAGRSLFLGLALVFSLAPFHWMLIASLKASDEQLVFGNPWWTWHPLWSNYSDLLTSPTFGHWMFNTALVTIATLAICLPASLMAAYALVHLRVPYSRSIVGVLFATYLLPQGVLFLPLVRMMSALHLLNSPWALVLAYPGLIIPFGTWVLWTFLRNLPADLVEFARLEGAFDFAILTRVLLPLALPAIGAVALFGIAIVFNDYLYAFALESNPAGQTLMAAVGSTSVDISDSGFLFSAVILGIAPVALACAFFADSYGRGLGSGVID